MQNLSEPSLWVIVTVLAGVIAFFGRYFLKKHAECEEDRDNLRADVLTVATNLSAYTGEPLSLRTLKGS